MKSLYGECRTVAMIALALILLACSDKQITEVAAEKQEAAVQVQYLEIVTTAVDETCSKLATQHGVTFDQPEPALGNARIATLSNGGRIGVRAALSEQETPVVRPYMLVADIEAASKAAEEAGAEFAMRSTEIDGHGTFAIYFLGGIQFGLWQL